MLHLPKNGISNIKILVNVKYVRNLHCILAFFHYCISFSGKTVLKTLRTYRGGLHNASDALHQIKWISRKITAFYKYSEY